jgi:hypothetical protein
MQKRVFVTGLFVLSLITGLFAQDKEKAEGSGNVVTRDVSVQPFDELQVSGVFNVSLIQGDKVQVKIEAEDNLQPLFQVTNEGSKLTISMKKGININTKTKMNVYVTFKTLTVIDMNTVGNVSTNSKLKLNDLSIKSNSVGSIDLKLDVQTMHVDNSGVGSVKLSGSADNAVIKNSGVGSIHAGDFIVQRMNINNSGVGSAEVNAEKELTVNDSFLGKIKNKGNASVKKLKKQDI